jgi:hypothetical protein
MWRSIAFTDGRWREVEVFVREAVAPSPAEWLALARTAIAPPYESLLRYFAQEDELNRPPYIGRSAIELWAEAAEADSREFNRDSPGLIEARDGALVFTWRDKVASGEPLNPVTVAWHDRTMVMIALTGDEERVLLEYIPSDDEVEREAEYRKRHASNAHRFETILEWRGYFGKECAIVDNWRTMRRQGNGYIASVGGAASYIAATVLRRVIGHRGPLYTKDPTRAERLSKMT